MPFILFFSQNDFFQLSKEIKCNELEINMYLGKDLDFIFKITNNTNSKIGTYTCYSIQNIEINTRLVFEFSICDKKDSIIRMLTTEDIYYNSDNCLKVLQCNSSYSICFNLKYVFKNINNFDINKENLKVHVDYIEVIESEFHKKTKDFIIREFSDDKTNGIK